MLKRVLPTTIINILFGVLLGSVFITWTMTLDHRYLFLTLTCILFCIVAGYGSFLSYESEYLQGETDQVERQIKWLRK